MCLKHDFSPPFLHLSLANIQPWGNPLCGMAGLGLDVLGPAEVYMQAKIQ